MTAPSHATQSRVALLLSVPVGRRTPQQVDELERWTRPLPLMTALRPPARRTVAASLSYRIVAPGEVVAAVGQPLEAVRALSDPIFETLLLPQSF
jgi:hypothetical protein